MASTKDVVDHHLSVSASAISTASYLTMRPVPFYSRRMNQLTQADAIRPLFQAMIAEFGKPGATFSMKQRFVECDYA